MQTKVYPIIPDLLMTPSDHGDGDLEMEHPEDRGNWTGKLDFLLSCIGYCVGLGNVWRFPYRAYTNGGACPVARGPQSPPPSECLRLDNPVRNIKRPDEYAWKSVLCRYGLSPSLSRVITVPTCQECNNVEVYMKYPDDIAIFLTTEGGEDSHNRNKQEWLIEATLLNILLMTIQCVNLLGAFLVPYFIMLAICGIPIFFMELSLGQFSSLGPLAVWKISPLFKGVGMATILIVSLVAIYYNMIIAYVLFYLFASLTKNLPWQYCGNWWNTDLCLDHHVMQTGNGAVPLNISNTVSPSEEYWSRYVLHIQESSGIGDPGRIRWNLCLCLFLAWVIVYLCILKGVKSSGKVVYFTATFPYLILIMLLIRGVTLEGAWLGIKFYLTPQFHHLLSSKVWIEAALQIFYSLGVGFGGLLTFASYNTFHQNIYRDTFIVTLGNAITSILAGFAIFSVLGYMSQELGVPVDQVAKAGPGLAFVVYPQAMTMLPLSPFWSFLFFFMLLTLGLDSQFAFLETIVTAVTDEFPYYLRPKKAFFSGIICVVMFLMGLILTTEDKQVKMRVVMPANVQALLVYSIIKYQPSVYGTYQFPPWAEVLGILMGVFSCLMIPMGMVFAVLQEEGTLWQRIQQASRSTLDWGPSLEENRTGMYVATLAGSQSPKPLMVHMRKYGGITSYENTAMQVDREIEEDEEDSMM
uniref:Sodium-dependent proline transporter n=1 Tax=Sphaerodactylus townsendi TaxID=933632 RepID=A0ACB8EIX7_9SAUR